MIEIEKVHTFGFEAALRGMRNPKNSWEKADTIYSPDGTPRKVGENDKQLIQRLVKAGSEHRKFLRMIHIQMDVTAPLYWWKEADTAKVGLSVNSCSTMHKIHEKTFTFADFSTEHLMEDGMVNLGRTIDYLNAARIKYIETKDKAWWWQMIQGLPTSYNQKRTLDFSYENALTFIHQRQGHKLDEWHDFCDVLKALPMMDTILASFD